MYPSNRLLVNETVSKKGSVSKTFFFLLHITSSCAQEKLNEKQR